MKYNIKLIKVTTEEMNVTIETDMTELEAMEYAANNCINFDNITETHEGKWFAKSIKSEK